MKYRVILSKSASQDILEIYNYISRRDSKHRAEEVYTNIKSSCFALETFPGKGHYPPELERIGVTLYREIHLKSYRIIYQISQEAVLIHAVVDGRRDIQDLLIARLIR